MTVCASKILAYKNFYHVIYRLKEKPHNIFRPSIKNPPRMKTNLNFMFSLDLNSRRSGSGFAHIRGFDHENVQLVGLGQVDIDGIVYKNITERDFTQYGSGFLGK